MLFKNKTTSLQKNSYLIAKTYKVVLARFTDYLLISIILFGFSYSVYNVHQWSMLTKIIVNHSLAIFLLLLYFIVLPTFLKGRTFAKLILRINLVRKENLRIKWYHLAYRELFISFIPWTILIISNLIISYGFNYSFFNFDNKNIFLMNSSQQKIPLGIQITLRVQSFFYLVWYVSFIILYKIDPYSQLFFDRWLNIYVVDFKKIKQQNITTEQEKITKKHVHLETNLPAIINDNEIEDINKL